MRSSITRSSATAATAADIDSPRLDRNIKSIARKPEKTSPPSPNEQRPRPVRKLRNIITEWNDEEQERLYDLSSVDGGVCVSPQSPAYSIDPWEVANSSVDHERVEAEQDAAAAPGSPRRPISPDASTEVSEQEHGNPSPATDIKSVCIMPGEIHPNMEHNPEDIERLRLLAGKLSADWRATGSMAAPALARRIRDFQFAQEKRRKKYGDERPWGILGLYDFLSSIRTDVQWAEECASRSANGEPYLSWADFDESKKHGYNRPFFTYILLFVCTVMLIASIAVNGWKVEPLDENPMIGPSAETLILMGAKDTYLIVNENQGWRLLTSSVLHAGLVHYFINMLALWFVGAAIESSHGWVAAMIIFIISAVGGTILSAIFLPDYITVGASGGIFGLVGACFADIIMNWKLLFCDFVTENGKKQSHIMVVAILVVDIVLNSLIGLTPYVDNFTHLGGMVYGFLCGISTMERLSTDFFGVEEAWASRAKDFFIRFFGLILSFVSIIVTLVVLLKGDGETNPCPNCTWLSCVPFPPWSDQKWWYCDACGSVTADIVSQPYLHLDLDCPDGNVESIDISNEDDVSRLALQKRLPAYCREYCSETQRN